MTCKFHFFYFSTKLFKQKLPSQEKKNNKDLSIHIPQQELLIKNDKASKKNNEKNIEKNEPEQKNNLLGKKVLFTSEKTAHTYHREIKLIQNRMSAKKCRQKKKNYIENMEKELSHYKNLVNNYQNILLKNQSIEDTFNLLIKKEEEATQENVSDTKVEEIKKEYKNAQNWLQEELIIKFIQSLVPLEYKIFYKKFLKLESVGKEDNLESVENKINKNIKM